MNWFIKFIIILISGFVFYLITGDGSEGVLLIVILSLLEFKYKKEKEYYQ